MRKSQRFAFLAIGGLGLLAAIAPGLAAGIAVPTTVPAAGQGAVEIKGFTVSNIDWMVDDDGVVTKVFFRIVRDVPNQNAVSSADNEQTGNAVVRARLEVGSGTGDSFAVTVADSSAWISCATTAVLTDHGDAECDFSTGTGGVPASALNRVNVIAFDRN